MIPLRSTEGVSRFPRSSFVFSLLLLIFNLFIYLLAKESVFLKLGRTSLWSWNELEFWVSLVLSSSFFNIFVNVLFVWVFTPQLFERRPWPGILLWSLLGAWLARLSFYHIHPQYLGPLFSLDAFAGVLLGLSLRKEIWSTVTTLVVGFSWIRLFEVPSYVLIFFWLFYLFLGNLWRRAELIEVPMLYWLPLFGLVFGFLGETLWMCFGLLKSRPKSPKLDENP